MPTTVFKVWMGDDTLPFPDEYLETEDLALTFGQAMADFLRVEIPVTEMTIADGPINARLAANLLNGEHRSWVEGEPRYLLPSPRRLGDAPMIVRDPETGGQNVVFEMEWLAAKRGEK